MRRKNAARQEKKEGGIKIPLFCCFTGAESAKKAKELIFRSGTGIKRR